MHGGWPVIEEDDVPPQDVNPQVYKMMMSPQQHDGSANPFTILNPKQLLYYLFLPEAPGSQIHCLGH